jgi:superfamily I DNA and/or RNA helicase
MSQVRACRLSQQCLGRCNNSRWLHQVLVYVQALKADRKARLADSDIGVILPYAKQCQKLRALLAGKGCGGVQVGSVPS